MLETRFPQPPIFVNPMIEIVIEPIIKTKACRASVKITALRPPKIV